MTTQYLISLPLPEERHQFVDTVIADLLSASMKLNPAPGCRVHGGQLIIAFPYATIAILGFTEKELEDWHRKFVANAKEYSTRLAKAIYDRA